MKLGAPFLIQIGIQCNRTGGVIRDRDVIEGISDLVFRIEVGNAGVYGIVCQNIHIFIPPDVILRVANCRGCSQGSRVVVANSVVGDRNKF